MSERVRELQREGLSVSEACEIAGLGRTKLCEAIGAGRLKARKYGKRPLFCAMTSGSSSQICLSPASCIGETEFGCPHMEVWRDLTDHPQGVTGSTRDAPQVVLDSIAESVKMGGARALHSDAVLGRLRSLSARQVLELAKRRPLRDHDISLDQLRALHGGDPATARPHGRDHVNSTAGKPEH